MAQRRPAPDAVQPASFAFDAGHAGWAKGQIAKYPAGRQASAVIPLLWAAQKQAGGWLPRAAIEHVAELLEMAPIRVMEVATFYTMFNLAPVGQHFIQLCGTVPCHCMGALELKDVLKARIGEEMHTTADGKFTWLEVECLGACCNAPMVQINDDYFEDLTPESLGALIDDLAAGKPVKPGPQNGRRASEPKDAIKTLRDQSLFDGSVVGSWRQAFDERVAAQKRAKEEAARAAEAAKAGGEAAKAAEAKAAADKAAADKALAEKTAAEKAAAENLHAKSAAKAPVAAEADAPLDAETETLLAAEEADIAAKLAALPKDASPEQKADAVGTRPDRLAEARDKKPDKLTRIKGIGPVNERKLHELGIFHFDQIAGWDRARIRWVGTFLAFPGRIDRERWLSQAANLAAGGKGLKD